MFERINFLVTECHFQFRSWQDRYGHGFWAVLIPFGADDEALLSVSGSGDNDALDGTDHMLATDWLPIATAGGSMLDALDNLEARLATLPLINAPVPLTNPHDNKAFADWCFMTIDSFNGLAPFAYGRGPLPEPLGRTFDAAIEQGRAKGVI